MRTIKLFSKLFFIITCFSVMPVQQAYANLNDNEINSIMSQLSRCWVLPVAAKGSGHDVYLDAEFNADGSYKNIQISNKSLTKYQSDAPFRNFSDSAMRAVRMCSPLKNLPSKKYNEWKSMELHFDPSDML